MNPNSSPTEVKWGQWYFRECQPRYQTRPVSRGLHEFSLPLPKNHMNLVKCWDIILAKSMGRKRKSERLNTSQKIQHSKEGEMSLISKLNSFSTALSPSFPVKQMKVGVPSKIENNFLMLWDLKLRGWPHSLHLGAIKEVRVETAHPQACQAC